MKLRLLVKSSSKELSEKKYSAAHIRDTALVHTQNLINCGANLNLEEFLTLGNYAELILAVIDSHRPLDLNNIQEQDEDSVFEVRKSAVLFRSARHCGTLFVGCTSLKSHASSACSGTAVHSRLW